ncbi:hypothetical protein TRFO_36618 [Tritrichomonas foetus]|uniref:Uncharacterized protein n=1 Tax=Tritrichomonas foetus TaxID=1144522 RepID=A0A1J4JDM3_9EUKA|nr:hypothetical protein TRFO_36618 [Tritrichomonas foetus]|eukprot:OHS97200.1 hypothetical protein TRFO_36618 [Tritrichomonas foetus]
MHDHFHPRGSTTRNSHANTMPSYSFLHLNSQTSRPLTQAKIMRPQTSIDAPILLKPISPSKSNFATTHDIYSTSSSTRKANSVYNYPGFHGESRMKPSPIHRTPVTEIITRYDFSPNKEELRCWKRINKSLRKTERKLKAQSIPKEGIYDLDSILPPTPPL